MRLIGHLNSEASARTFGVYLTGMDIRNLIEPDNDGWAVWVYSEDQIKAGEEAFRAYQTNPGDDKYQQAGKRVVEMEERARREAKAYARRVKTSDQIWTGAGHARLTIGLVVACVVVYLFYTVNPNEIEGWLRMSWPAILSGEVWRLVTPLFLHFNLTHILFNMVALWQLGAIVELRQGWARLALIVVGVGIGSNLAQYFLGNSYFGGMSGVLYGLLGYIWLRGRLDPGSGYYLPPSYLLIMLVWFFLCLFNIVPDVANWAHGAGLVLGMAWGALPLVKRHL